MIDNADEFESVCLIRFPEKIAAEINEKLKSENGKVKASMDGRIMDADLFEKRLSIKFNQDKRNCTASWSNSTEVVNLKGRLCDLPTVVEAYKTTDKKTFYKSGTISQMIICAENEAEINPQHKKYHGSKDPRRFQLLHGLTPPLKNVKKSRFRKIIRKRHCEAPEVEKELKRLLRDDMDAETVDFELVPDPEWEKKKNRTSNAIIPDMTSSEDSNDDDDEDKPDFEQHQRWTLPDNDNGRCMRLQQQAQKLSNDITKLRDRQANRQRELDSAHKEEKKERLRQDIEDIKHKEKEKEKQYFETVEKYAKRMMKAGLKL